MQAGRQRGLLGQHLWYKAKTVRAAGKKLISLED